MVLVGRSTEQQAIERLVAGARVGSSGVLVLTGEPGAGKSALLRHALSRLDGLRVLRATGLEVERDIPFAGLLQLLRPTLAVIDRIPRPQAEALSAALAVQPASSGREGSDRFAVGAATLSLVCQYAEDGPVAVVVDDLHLLDRPSAEALAFAARRLTSDPVVLLAAARTPEADRLLSGIPVMAVPGLDVTAARELVRASFGHTHTDEQLIALHRATAGNPLALLELGRAGPEALDGLHADLPVRVPAAVTAAFTQRLADLDEGCRLALLVVAVAGGDLPVTAAACAGLGGDAAALGAAEDAGLITVSADRVTFSHPLLRAATYSAASVAQRAAAHRAVAQVLPEQDVDRRALHLAEATWRPDAAVSALLVTAAEQAAARAAFSVASNAYERAARLSVDSRTRGQRLLDAAEAAWSAGMGPRALMLLDAHAGEAAGARTSVTGLELRATIAARTGSLGEALDTLLRAADLAEDPDQQTVLLADAVHATFYLADARTASTLASRLAALEPRVASTRARALGLMATGIARILAGEGGGDEIRAAVPLLESTPELRREPRRLSWLMLAPLFLREATGGTRLREIVDDVRSAAGVGTLPAVLFHVARDQATTASWPQAGANYAEAIRLARETGQATELAMSLAGLCWLESRQGREAECRRHGAEARALCGDRELHLGEVWVLHAVGDLELALGRADEALVYLQQLAQLLERQGIVDADLDPAPELTEVLLRLGRRHEAEEVARRYRARARSKGQPWALARADRASGQVGPDADLDSWFGSALTEHDRTLDTFETARTRIAYGERLRRAGRRVDARVQLRQALDDFDRLGAGPWAERAVVELAATGEHVQRSGAGAAPVLTPQELQVSLLLADGLTTREAAAALFLSPKTVEYHLRKVYSKLSIRSRSELAAALDPSRAAAPPG